MTLVASLIRPAFSLLVAVLLPQLTGWLLARRYLRGLPPGGEDRARGLVPYRRAALFVGFGQLQLAWTLGVTALGPRVLEQPYGAGAYAFGALCAVAAFISGGVARRAEQPSRLRPTVWGTALLRLRLVPWFVAPLAVGLAAARLPVVRHADGAIDWPWVFVALLVCSAGVAFGGIVLSLLTGAVRLAPQWLRALAGEVAERERTRLWLTLRLPTPGAHFANAAAIPWARTMVVTDGAAELLPSEQLRAVLAHEAGHLSEPPVVAAARLAAATVILFAVTIGVRVATAFAPVAAPFAIGASVVVAIALLLAVRRLARRMEQRADARACETVGPVPLAEALRRLHAHAQQPLVTGRKRVHPDLYDRLAALGLDPGPRPAPPPRGGFVLGAAIALVLVTAPLAVAQATALEGRPPSEIAMGEARVRQFVDPWDGRAMLALGWHELRAEQPEAAERRARRAARMGVPRSGYWTLWAELHAVRGECAAADDAARRARAEGGPSPAARAPTWAARCGGRGR